ncbi:M28 family peptidase [Chitinophagaceae bacterium LB-8]|uniref:M28 family peptidase n=1 Tax=Paraflavisolibacter caeni TaxID=2982496 RepID=A0A9X3B9B2_9BACT|nr:M28 family peptidase [Paraflavisolibacter caeni]MCU7550941.1 M28 family peptidase [Paraflavisolibacter caeni]
MRNYFLILFLLIFGATEAQKLKKEDKQLVANLQAHIQYLASDELQGRRTGTQGEALAMKYISDKFKGVGLAPKGTNDYLQPFVINEGKQVNPSTHLIVGGQALTLYKDFFPLAFSGNASLEALPSMAIQEVQMPWFWDIKEVVEENKGNPHWDVYAAIEKKAEDAQKKSATALFVFNTSATKDNIQFKGSERPSQLSIPVVYLTKEAVSKYFNDESATLDIKLKTDISPKSRTGNNVIGFIDNGAPTTIVFGAHFDHLGLGEDGNSLQQGSKDIHNGADDNASGISALIELARMLKASSLKQNNYLFVAFSGEEQGLYGSKYFTENPTVDLGSVSYMINMDMIGRLNPSSPVLTVGGFGTSPSWGAVYNATGKKSIYKGALQFRFDSSGVGPSDHTSFYRKSIPVLFYFTGLHSDYHKPTDDADKINYTGELQVIKHIYSLVEVQSRNAGKVAFTPTKEMQMNATASFKVTLGIMPDYSFSGNGVRVDGVTEGRPAQKAGLKAGDVIVKLGDHAIGSLESYMEALSKFNKGDKTTVYYNRGSENHSSPVEFQ